MVPPAAVVAACEMVLGLRPLLVRKGPVEEVLEELLAAIARLAHLGERLFCEVLLEGAATAVKS